MKKFIFFTNIPTPYRTSFYNELHKCGLNLAVYYMRHIEADRNWKVDLDQMKHPFYIDRGFYTMIGRFHVHFNPRLILKLLKEKDVEIIIGGSWNDIDVLLLVMLRRLGLYKAEMHFWSEANYMTIGASNDNAVKRFLRKFVYNCSDGKQISSGKMTEMTLERWGVRKKTFVPLPNTIEEEKYRISGEDLDSRYRNEVPVFLMPIRLLENVKGMVNFFTAIGIENVRRALFLIAGDGPDKEKVEAFISSHGVGDNIKLVGYCDTERMVALYKAANVFLLPSFSDPSPLTLVEALCMRLPVLVSERCGNHFEAVVEGQNGYCFDPFDQSSVKKAFESILERRNEWRDMGEKSGELYRATFERRTAISNFILGITGSSKARNCAPAFGPL